jgi:hypothetical protein
MIVSYKRDPLRGLQAGLPVDQATDWCQSTHNLQPLGVALDFVPPEKYPKSKGELLESIMPNFKKRSIKAIMKQTAKVSLVWVLEDIINSSDGDSPSLYIAKVKVHLETLKSSAFGHRFAGKYPRRLAAIKRLVPDEMLARLKGPVLQVWIVDRARYIEGD